MTEAVRLPWERKAPGSFVAYPIGRDRSNFMAHVAAKPERSYLKWSWGVTAGGVRKSGEATTKQEAADAATVAWPQVLAELEQTETQRAAQRALSARLDEIDRSGVVDVAEFAIEAKGRAELLGLIKECRERWARHFHAGTATPGIEALMGALSAEFYRRRLIADQPSATGAR